MAVSIDPKAFEEKFKRDWIRCFPDGVIVRLYDQVSGFKAIANVSDFITYNYPNIFFIECKTHKGASIPFDAIPQYDKLKKMVGKKGVRSGVILFLYEKDRVFYIPASTITQLKAEGKKSVGIKAFESGYNIIEIPSKKLRVFMDSDYTVLMDLKEGD